MEQSEKENYLIAAALFGVFVILLGIIQLLQINTLNCLAGLALIGAGAWLTRWAMRKAVRVPLSHFREPKVWTTRNGIKKRVHLKDGADLFGCKLKNLDLHKVNLQGANLREATLDGSDLQQAILGEYDWGGADWGSGANLEYASLKNCNLRGAYLAGCNMHGADFTNADLRDAVFSYVVNNKKYLTNPGDYSSIDFMDLAATAQIKKASFINANLEATEITGGEQSSFQGANLRRAKLEGSYESADFRGADLTGADLSNTNLRGANFAGAILDYANFDKALYTNRTKWPEGFDPTKNGSFDVSEADF